MGTGRDGRRGTTTELHDELGLVSAGPPEAMGPPAVCPGVLYRHEHALADFCSLVARCHGLELEHAGGVRPCVEADPEVGCRACAIAGSGAVAHAPPPVGVVRRIGRRLGIAD